MARAVHVHDHVVLAAPVGHGLDRGPANHQVHHHDHRAQVFGKFGPLVHVFHGGAGDIEVAAFDFARLGAGLGDRVHHKQKAVTPVHKGLAVDVLVVLHEVQAAFEAFVHHASIVTARQAQLGLGGGAQQGAAKFVQTLALHHQAGGRPLESLDVGHRNANVLQACRLERLEAEHIANQAGGHVRNRAFFKQDQVISHIGEILAGVVGHGNDLVGLGAVAVASGQAVGPHHGPGGGAGFTSHGCGGFFRVHAVLRGDAKQAQRVGVFGHVVRHPVAHLLVFQNAGAVALFSVGDLAGAAVGVAHVCLLKGFIGWLGTNVLAA